MTQQPDWGAPAHMQEPAAPGAPKPEEAEVIGNRILGAIIDLVAGNVVGFFVALAVGLLAVFVTGSFAAGSMALVYLVGGLAVLGYFVVMEATQGQTIGKMMMGVRVVRADDGEQITWGQAIGRNVLRFVDGIMLYLVGFMVAMSNPMRQRVGDMAAGTVVIEE